MCDGCSVSKVTTKKVARKLRHTVIEGKGDDDRTTKKVARKLRAIVLVRGREGVYSGLRRYCAVLCADSSLFI